eukprot:4276938-Prymnesium_polylepis.1
MSRPPCQKTAYIMAKRQAIAHLRFPHHAVLDLKFAGAATAPSTDNSEAARVGDHPGEVTTSGEPACVATLSVVIDSNFATPHMAPTTPGAQPAALVLTPGHSAASLCESEQGLSHRL